MSSTSLDSFKCKTTLSAGGTEYTYYSLPKAAQNLGIDLTKLPFSLKILLENLLRYEDNNSVKKDDISAFATWLKEKRSSREIAYRPARVLMQDFTGVPAVVDLAAMRDAMKKLGGDPELINPLSPVDLVIDHSVMVDRYASDSAFKENVQLEMERNAERYEFLRWGQQAFDNFRVVPPGTGICHQVNLEYLAQVVWTKDNVAFPDTLVGTDSHTTMVNGLGVLGWGVGGIEAEAAMLGQPISMVIPEVVGFKLTGKLPEGATATDLVLTVTQMLRQKGVVGKFVEFYGSGLADMQLADRATIANMAPEYGATCGIFPVDQETLRYMELTGRDKDRIALTEAYAKAQGMWRDESAEATYSDTLSLDMSTVQPSIAGPKRPQDKIALADAKTAFNKFMSELDIKNTPSSNANKSTGEIAPSKSRVSDGMQDQTLDKRLDDEHIHLRTDESKLNHGDVVIAAITSCTNTSNPSVMIAAGLVAKKARALGLKVKPWVKTSLAPGSKVVTEYLERSNLQDDLDALGFNLVGYGCTTCIGNSGPLLAPIEQNIKDNHLVVSSVLSGNRNFEGRVHQLVKSNYLASPPLVVAYAIAGSMQIDITKEPLARSADGKDIYLKDIWPTNKEIADIVASCVTREMFMEKYADVFSGDEAWKQVPVTEGKTYSWNGESTYVQHPPYFEGMSAKASSETSNVEDARILALLGDSITTDHISPAGSIAKNSPAAKYLSEHGVAPADFNSYGSRRGNHEVMMRGTFANVRIKNEMLDGTEGGYTKHIPTGEEVSIYDAAMRYQAESTPLVVIAGKEYGTGSSRDWAAKGTNLLGVKAVIAESFERIHRSNLVGMGVLPLVFTGDTTRKTLKLTGEEIITISGLEQGLKPGMKLTMHVKYTDGSTKEAELLCRIDTQDEVEYYLNSGILHYVLRQLQGGGDGGARKAA